MRYAVRCFLWSVTLFVAACSDPASSDPASSDAFWYEGMFVPIWAEGEMYSFDTSDGMYGLQNLEDFQQDVQILIDSDEPFTYTLDNPYFLPNPWGVASGAALVYFATETAGAVNVQITDPDTQAVDPNASYTVSSNTMNHIVPLTGLFVGRTNTVTLSFGSQSHTMRFYLPDTEKYTVTVTQPGGEDAFLGLEVLDVASYSIFDKQGRLRYLVAPLGGVASVIAYQSTNDGGKGYIWTFAPYGKTMSMARYDPVGYLLDYNTDYAEELEVHHDYIELSGGGWLALGTDRINKKVTTSTGDTLNTIGDLWFFMDADWNITQTVDVADILDYRRYGDRKDWLHENSIMYEDDNNWYVMSGPGENTIMALDADSLDLVWILSSHEDWEGTGRTSYQAKDFSPYLLTAVDGQGNVYSDDIQTGATTVDQSEFAWPGGQHYAKSWLAQNRLLMYDNNHLRIVVYEIDVQSMTVQQIWEFPTGRTSGGALGTAQYIPETDTVMVSAHEDAADDAWLMEVPLYGTAKVWEAHVEPGPDVYRSEKLLLLP